MIASIVRPQRLRIVATNTAIKLHCGARAKALQLATRDDLSEYQVEELVRTEKLVSRGVTL